MSLDSISMALIGATALFSYTGWKLIDNRDDVVNTIGSFLVLVSINLAVGLVYFSFLVAENVPYNYLVTQLLPVVTTVMWVSAVITVAYFVRVIFMIIQLIFNLLSNKGSREDRENYGNDD